MDFSSIQQTNYDAKKEIPNNLFQENTKEGLNHDSQFFSSKRMGLSEEPEDEEKGLISKDFIMQLEEEIEEENQIVQT